MENNFQIENIENGQEASGELPVTVHITDADMEQQGLDLMVDDEDWNTFWIERGPPAGPLFFGEIVLPTQKLSNGIHTLRVQDSIRSRAASPQSDMRTVRVSNTISEMAYDVLFYAHSDDPERRKTCRIRARLTPPQPWQVQIIRNEFELLNLRLQATGRHYYDQIREYEVRSFQGEGEEIDVTWDGTDAEGILMPCDNYWLVVTAMTTGETYRTHTAITPVPYPYQKLLRPSSG